MYIYCLLYLSDSGEVFDYLVAHGRMKEKEARAKFRQVWKVVFNFVLLMFLVVCNGQYHKQLWEYMDFSKEKFSFLTVFKNGKFLEKKPISPEFCFKIVVADGCFEMTMNGDIS